MKTSKIYIALSVILIMFTLSGIAAQSISTNVPAAVTNAFIAKYPDAEIKHWNMLNSLYIAKVSAKNHNYTVAFNPNGDWVSTTEKINWPWNLPAVIKSALNKSKYKNWNIYNVKIVEKPSGQFYQVLVNDRNHPIDIYHQDLVTEQRIIEIKADGELIKEFAPADNASL